ncbi:uncharacterized protein LOC113322843 [Papaver somniferum]|uniref:uncharacterized protein LOC113322843 n=1 Tax=Papaver somniferum TaxID=3469 RepID=UPI000E6F8FC1|nr:uncharacterized protein LOC113322843 [Papaver somniferum]
MFRSVWCKLGGTLNRAASSSTLLSAPTAAKFSHFTETRVTSIFFSTTTASNNANTCDSSSFVVSYLINSCGLSESEAISTSKKLNFKTTTKPDSVLTLLKTYGFTESHISKLITKHPAILSSDPHKTLKPKLDFFKSKGLYGTDLADFVSIGPRILMNSFIKVIIPSFDIFKSILDSDENVIQMIKQNSWILSTCRVENVMVNIELLRNQGVPETKISNYLIWHSRVFTQDADKFRKIVEKTKEMGFNPLKTTFLVAIRGQTSMTEANWEKKKDVYKRLGWSEDQIQLAFRKNPCCMTASGKKIMAVINFLVNEMGYDSSSVAECPLILDRSLKRRIIPRCSVIRILVSKGLIKESIPLGSVSTMLDEAFLEKFVSKYEHQVPRLMKVFQGQLNYHQLLQS